MSATPTTEPAAGRDRGRLALEAFSRSWLFVFLLLLLAFFWLSTPSGTFLTRANLSQIALSTSEVVLLAIGETFVIVTAGIDLSIGGVLIFSGVIAGKVMLALYSGHPGIGAADAPWSVILCGMRDVRDYKVASGGGPVRMGSSSPFNMGASCRNTSAPRASTISSGRASPCLCAGIAKSVYGVRTNSASASASGADDWSSEFPGTTVSLSLSSIWTPSRPAVGNEGYARGRRRQSGRFLTRRVAARYGSQPSSYAERSSGPNCAYASCGFVVSSSTLAPCFAAASDTG